MSDRFVAQRRGLIEKLRERGIKDLAILQAFDLVPRHAFLPQAVRHRAYEDAPVPIGFGQTASQPSLQALYLQLLGLEPTDKVLEIGTGSGYQTALLSRLASNVYSIERLHPLAARAREVLDELRISNVAILVGDGSIGWSHYAPYQGILVAAAAPDVPEPLAGQLAIGGQMLVPVGSLESQRLVLVTRTEQGYHEEQVLECTFVPLVGRFGWSEPGKGEG